MAVLLAGNTAQWKLGQEAEEPPVQSPSWHPTLSSAICARGSRGRGKCPVGQGEHACLQPQVVLGFVGHLALVVRDVASANDTVHGPFVGVRVVSEGPAVMQSELVFHSWGQSEDTREQTQAEDPQGHLKAPRVQPHNKVMKLSSMEGNRHCPIHIPGTITLAWLAAPRTCVSACWLPPVVAFR